MDTLRIIQNEGYRFDDLNKQNQDVIRWLNWLIDDIAEKKADYIDTEDMGLWEKLQNEIARDVVDEIVDHARIQIAEYQIALIEN